MLARRLADAGLGLDDLDAIFISHEHGDHIGCAAQVVRQHHMPISPQDGQQVELWGVVVAAIKQFKT